MKRVCFILTAVCLILSSCIGTKKEPPQIYTIESLLTEYDAEIKDWSSAPYLTSCYFHFGKDLVLDTSMFFRSYNVPYGGLMLTIRDDGTTSTSAFGIDPDKYQYPTVPITDLLKIDSTEALRIFYDDEVVQNKLRRHPADRLAYEYMKPECKKPVWELSLQDGMLSIRFYLDPDSLTVLGRVVYLDSEGYQENCGGN